jgi:hypothetical protein
MVFELQGMWKDVVETLIRDKVAEICLGRHKTAVSESGFEVVIPRLQSRSGTHSITTFWWTLRSQNGVRHRGPSLGPSGGRCSSELGQRGQLTAYIPAGQQQTHVWQRQSIVSFSFTCRPATAGGA